jgi:hypothetical protein
MFSANSSQVSDDKLFVEDVFSTWLYTGTGSAQTITNGIDLSGKGGMVWSKARTQVYSEGNCIADTLRGAGNDQFTSTNYGYDTGSITSFNSNGFSLSGGIWRNSSGQNYASWTFREAPKFFDVVTYTGTGANRTIAHSLGVAPGCILVKRTDTTGDWQVYHRSNANTQYMVLNATAAVATGATRWNSTTPTATEFTVGTDATVNASGGTYVAYLFAHDTTSDGIIQCGSYTGTGAVGNSVTLGWEPQWLMVKNASGLASWNLFDNMRGLPVGSSDAILAANTSAAESSVEYVSPTATGFQIMATSDPQVNANGSTYIYIAIRRGPMKTPTSGTSVFAPVARTGTGANATISTGFVTDFVISKGRSGDYAANSPYETDRLRGSTNTLNVSSTGSEFSTNHITSFASNTGFTAGNFSDTNGTNTTYIDWCFRRAPGFFDEVCYTGNGASPQTLNHNLGVTPELMIVKQRNTSSPWTVYAASQGLNTGYLNRGDLGFDNNSNWGAVPTSTTFSVQGSSQNASGGTFVAYLFASCPGVSKCGTYTGNGSSQTINCGFAAGARFVMIKRTDSTGDWYVWDTARGIVSGNDPHLSLNTTAAEVTTDDTIDTDSSGFVVNQVAATNVNVNAATYIYMAVA